MHKIVLKLISIISLIMSVLMVPSFITSLIYDNMDTALAFGFVIIALFSAGNVIFNRIKKFQSKLTAKQGLFLVSVSWIIISLCSALPYYFSGVFDSLADCLFEAASGVTTTGMTVMTDIEAQAMGIILWRSTTEWLGALGVIMLTVALLPLLGIGGLQLFKAEITGIEKDKVTPRIAQTASILWGIYITFTIISFVALKIAGMDTFDAINHAMTVTASGGFSTRNGGIGWISSSATVQNVLTICMFISAINYTIFYLAIMGRFKTIRRNTELKTYIIISVLMGFLVSVSNYKAGVYPSFIESLRHGYFQSMAFISTTGYGIANYELWPAFSQFLLICMMFVGGCAGSTSGGFKVLRFSVLLKQSLNEIKYMLHPRGIFTVRLNKMPVSKDIVYAVLGFLFMYLSGIAAVVLVSSLDTDLFSSISMGLAVMSNTGLGFGSVSDSCAHFPWYSKIFFALSMIAARLEIYTFFALLTPYFWRKFR